MKGFSTKCVHKGTFHSEVKSVNTPIFQTSNFLLDDKDYEKIIEGKAIEVNLYTRYSNPSRRAVEEKIKELEFADDAITFSSGMAAISTTLLTFLKPKGRLLTTIDIYGGTTYLVNNILKNYDIDVKHSDPFDTGDIIKKMKNVDVILFESLSNPLLKLIDIEEISKNKREGQILIIDNTFLTPYNLNPMKLGVDIVIHSASKYLNGHSDLIAGIVCGKKEYIDKIRENMILLGGSMEPLSAFLLERGLKTLGIRMERHNKNGYEIARFLKGKKKVKKVFYPGLEEYPKYELAKRLLKNGFGGMVTFVIEGGDEEGVRFMHRLKIIKEATSLGGVESLVSMPFNTSHTGLSEEERIKIGIEPGTIRLSCGIEDVEDLKDDLENALS
uniref:Aminotransferase class I/II-fold pyridoxal phosphate-dependent enzyme n=1 Tax=candidate division WOR-3 bacterium TaxID=2052148 RepID=A0A7C4UDL3_UNCW3